MSGVDLVVCALTFRRPDALRRLLEGMAKVREPAGCLVSLVIVDNDPSGSAHDLVDEAKATIGFPISYEIEAVPGIVAARNRAIRVAGDCDFVAFIDDDEVPSPEWLEELVAVQRRTGADIVTGTVAASFDQPPPGWMLSGGFFDRPRHLDGEIIHYARTGNVLIAHPVVAAHDPPFDPAYGLSGGEDTHFFLRARLEGFRIAWADNAVVTETLSAERVSPRWVVTREYRRGNTLSLCLRNLQDSPRRRIRRVTRALLEIAFGAAETATAVRHGRQGLLRAARRVALGVGMLTGLAGFRFSPYREQHRRS